MQKPLAAEVLVVDDDRLNQALAQAVLKSAGLGSRTADNAAQCLALYEEMRPRCVLMDLRLAGESGVEVAQAIRQLEHHLGLKPATLIAVSAETQAKHRERCLRAGMNQYLEKPYMPAELLDLVRQALAT